MTKEGKASNASKMTDMAEIGVFLQKANGYLSIANDLARDIWDMGIDMGEGRTEKEKQLLFKMRVTAMLIQRLLNNAEEMLEVVEQVYNRPKPFIWR